VRRELEVFHIVFGFRKNRNGTTGCTPNGNPLPSEAGVKVPAWVIHPDYGWRWVFAMPTDGAGASADWPLFGEEDRSDLLVAVFGDAGRHVRAAIGVNGLPLGAAVEVQMTVEIH
jgi:hypothetical protein